MSALRITVLLSIVVALVLVLCVVCVQVEPMELDGWGFGSPIVARDGRTYRPAWGWWSVAVAREDVKPSGGTSRTIVAEGGTDSPCRYVAFISPGGRPPDRLVEATDGTLVVVNWGTSYLAYDPKSGRTIQGDAIADISPFLLLSPDAEVPEQDVKALEAKAVDARSDRTGIGWIAPSDDVLVRELESPNASVRQAARRIAAAGGEALYPRASKAR